MKSTRSYAVVLSCLLIAVSAHSQLRLSKHEFETEAQRLENIRLIVREQRSTRLIVGVNEGYEKTAAFCNSILEDLFKPRAFKPIEPIAILDFEYPILDPDRSQIEKNKMSKVVEKKVGTKLNNKIQRCSREEATGDERKGSVIFNGFEYFTGAPPFRLYVLPKKLNPFPEGEIIYWSELTEKGFTGRKGYSWVNLNICEHLSLSPDWPWSVKSNPTGPFGALSQYRNQLAVWSVLPEVSFTSVFYETPNIGEVAKPIICHWTFFSEAVSPESK